MLTISAVTTAILMEENETVKCRVEVEGKNDRMKLEAEDIAEVNLDLGGDIARLTGYPRHWAIFENHELDEDSENEVEYDIFISKDSEKEIFIQLKASLQRQFQNENYKMYLSQNEKEQVLTKMDKAISSRSR